MIAELRRRPALLALVPVATYVLSYIHLARYHGTPFLINTVVHESGRYTLLENTLYTPHFLGHIPVLITLALLMAGSQRWLAVEGSPEEPATRLWAGIALAALILASLTFSLTHWGATETWEFITQQRQRPDLLVPGGSWLLHLPSTISLVLGLPLFVLAARWIFDRPTRLGPHGRLLFGLGVLSIPGITLLVVPNPVATAAATLLDPRYLGHAVRELATFPLTYLPLPLAWWLSREPEGTGFRWSRKLRVCASIAGALFTIIVAYQVLVPLEHGVSDLVQRPDFARAGGLSVPYLLASHYFEHFLDTVFFTLLCLVLVPVQPRAVS